MFGDLTIQFILIVVGIGLLGLIPVLYINSRSSKIDDDMYKKEYDARKDLESFRAEDLEEISHAAANKKLRKFDETNK